jgi:hypothetical protein
MTKADVLLRGFEPRKDDNWSWRNERPWDNPSTITPAAVALAGEVSRRVSIV